MRIRDLPVQPLGSSALRIAVPDLATAHSVFDTIRAAGIAAVLDVVPAAHSVVVTVTSPDQLDRARAGVTALVVSSGLVRRSRHHDIDVSYDGPDLDELADHCGRSVSDVVGLHSAPIYTVAFLGFLPGFGYLNGLDDALHTPRRSSPRQRIRRGSVGIADDVTGIYPDASPGGWQIIGHTDTVMFDVARDDPALLAPGDTVRFRAIG